MGLKSYPNSVIGTPIEVEPTYDNFLKETYLQTVTDPYFNYVTLLLHGDNTNGTPGANPGGFYFAGGGGGSGPGGSVPGGAGGGGGTTGGGTGAGGNGTTNTGGGGGRSSSGGSGIVMIAYQAFY